ncbi:MAG: flagellar biosynthesis protein FlhF [SAR324 cluster bacterium]|uniref:Flagellar biosynthesis protein FlhF n=1 Tax=SAR324 cluster bacterium TaxID=2024889 RepID=A0A432H2P9_9DELT|nr:MAG: flagellar biosynthesis protein FlhF [SAR324 cluster bacterium]
MNLKRYRVNNIKEALKFIKRDLGSDAMIVSTRQVKENTGAFGLFGKTMLEVTASASEKKKDNRSSVPATKALETYGGSSETSETVLADTFLTPRNKSVLSVRDETRKMMLPIQKELQGIRITLGDLSSQSDGLDKHLMGELKHELGEMRHMMHILATHTGSIAEPDLPENLLLLYQQMKFSGMEERFSRRLVMEAQLNMTTEDIENFAYVKIFIARMLMKIIKITRGMEGLKSPQKIVALLGPTGVGKTTTLAKIASEQMLKYKRKVALISVDTNHSSAAEQIRSFAKKIKAPFNVVKYKAEMNRIIDSYESYDSIIIDTDGCSQRNEKQLYEMREIFDERGRIHNALVLSATSKDSDMSEVTRKFGCMPIDSIIFTKLDESASYGSLFNHAIRFKKPLSYLTIGQKVPEDIEVASRERLVDLLLNISGT